MSSVGLTERRPLSADRLTGTQKAAVLLAAIGPEASARITKSLQPEELELISLEIARLGDVPLELVEAILAEWEQTGNAVVSLAQGGVAMARQILERAMGADKAATVLERIEAQLQEGPALTLLKNADPQQVAMLVRHEHPQMIALICAHLDPAQTASVLQEFPPALATEVIYRMAKMEKIMPEVVAIVERSFTSATALNMAQDLSASGGPAAVAAVLNLVNTSFEKELMDGVAAQDPELVEEIRNLMFVFEDLRRLDDRSLQRLLRDVDMKTLALALKAASDELKRKIHGTMSQRALGTLKEEMEMMGPVKVKDVETAQADIVKLVRTLEEAGEVTVAGGGSDDVFI